MKFFVLSVSSWSASGIVDAQGTETRPVFYSTALAFATILQIISADDLLKVQEGRCRREDADCRAVHGRRIRVRVGSK